MEHRIFRGATINNLRTYMSQSMQKEIITSANMFCLCAMEKGRVKGVGVFEAGDAARIYEINVTETNRNKGVEKEILDEVIQTLADAGSKIVTMKVHDGDDVSFWEPLLLRSDFVVGKASAFYHFLLVDAYASPLIKKAKCPPRIVCLSDVPEWQRVDYDKRLKERRQFEHLMDECISKSMSAVYLQDNQIDGCFLISEFEGKPGENGEECGIYVEYASTRGVRDPLAIIEMIRFSMEKVWKVHAPDEHGYILSMDRTVERIFQRLFPSGRLAGGVREFVHTFE